VKLSYCAKISPCSQLPQIPSDHARILPAEPLSRSMIGPMAIPDTLARKRGNPNWGRPIPSGPAVATEFELRVSQLQLTPGRRSGVCAAARRVPVIRHTVRKQSLSGGRPSPIKCKGPVPLKSNWDRKEEPYLGIRYDPGMFSSRVARTAPFAVASLLK